MTEDEYLQMMAEDSGVTVEVLKQQMEFRPGVYLCLFRDEDEYHQETFEAHSELDALHKAEEWIERQTSPAASTQPEDLLDYFMGMKFWEAANRAILIQPLSLLTDTALIAIEEDNQRA
jgi:hypothetical protein